MTSRLDRPAAPYRQIADRLRARIESGDLKPGDKVPSVRALLREYGVAMATAQRAHAILRSEGLIRPEPGVGSVVTTGDERGWASSDWVERSHWTGKVYPEGQRAVIVSAETVRSSKLVAEALGVRTGSRVIRRDRLIYQGERVISMSTSWFAGSFAKHAPALLERDRIREGTFAYLASALGRGLGSWLDQYEAVPASADAASALGVEKGAPVIYGRNWIYDERGDVLEYGEAVTLGRVSYRGELPA
jgi:DNA-binding GntR family transcriptional regulator